MPSDREEVRLAVVMNGGVSLAVWMAGVTHELDLIRRSTGEQPSDPDQLVREHWATLCAEQNVRVVVDVVAGTSAGGLNGAVLAACAAHDVPLPAGLRDAWRRAAALTKDAMLKERDQPQSLLNGEFFEDAIKTLFDQVNGAERGSDRAVTLFVTATALGGRSGEGTDDTDRPFPFEDHRRLYRFVHDPDRRRYDPEGADAFPANPRRDFHTAREALPRAARASASFPMAFEPVSEDKLLIPAREDERLRVLPDEATDPGEASLLMDGGVLDNAPFGPVIQEIATRPVTGPYRRILAYVVPTSTAPAGHTTGPGDPVGVGLRAVQLPREVDFRTDVQELRDYLAGVSESPHRALYVRMRDNRSNDRDKLTAVAQALVEEYRRSRAVQGVWEARTRMSTSPLRIPLRSDRPIDPDAVIGGATPLWLPAPEASISPVPGQPWRWGLSTAQQAVLMLLRDPLEWLSPVADRQSPGRPVRFTDTADLARHLSELLAQIRAIEDRVNRDIAANPDPLTDAQVAAHIDRVFADLHVPEQLDRIVHSAVSAYVNGLPPQIRQDLPAAEAQVVSWTVAADVLVRTFAPPAVRRPAPPLQFVRIGPDIESPLFPAYNDLGDRKLYGTRVGHFGAFATEEARARDWLWGRLDAAAHLTRLLMPGDEQRVETVQRLILQSEARGWPSGGLTEQELTDRVNKAAQTLRGPDSELVAAYLATDAGRETAKLTGRSALLLVTSFGRSGRRPWQAPVQAILDHGRPTSMRWRDAGLRGLTWQLRKRLWAVALSDPLHLHRRAPAVLRDWTVALVAALGFCAVTLGAVAGIGTAAGNQPVRATCAVLLTAALYVLIRLALGLVLTPGRRLWLFALPPAALVAAALFLFWV